jgi:hypothetical protein
MPEFRDACTDLAVGAVHGYCLQHLLYAYFSLAHEVMIMSELFMNIATHQTKYKSHRDEGNWFEITF